MSDASGENPMHDDREWIDAAARIWAPEPRSPAQRARFAAAVAERRAQPRRLAWALPGAVAAATAAVAVMLVVAGGQRERSDSSAAASVASGDVLVALALDDAASVAAADESLPDDYVLLEEALGL